ncbi:hypothetical protein KTJ89_06595 [Brevibacterium sediminis]|uniref:hypothetical protein n=1 Tax=Brevibacterium sediminis TaxID=1857024 RepID=UPI002174D482|nr:hypothetical protein [Brevibacterium sediminis]MCS4592653.1 hypothetical protein [Brevibacterium sediminis]
MALIRLTRFDEHVTAEEISQEPRETLVNTQVIEWVTTLVKADRIYLGIKIVGETGTRHYAAVNAIGNNTVYEMSAEQVLREFQSFVQAAEERE